MRAASVSREARRKRSVLDGDTLLREYEKETARQRLLIKQAKLCETKLLFVIASLRQLLGDGEFVSVLRDQALDEVPSHLSEQIFGSQRKTR